MGPVKTEPKAPASDLSCPADSEADYCLWIAVGAAAAVLFGFGLCYVVRLGFGR